MYSSYYILYGVLLLSLLAAARNRLPPTIARTEHRLHCYLALGTGDLFTDRNSPYSIQYRTKYDNVINIGRGLTDVLYVQYGVVRYLDGGPYPIPSHECARVTKSIASRLGGLACAMSATNGV